MRSEQKMLNDKNIKYKTLNTKAMLQNQYSMIKVKWGSRNYERKLKDSYKSNMTKRFK